MLKCVDRILLRVPSVAAGVGFYRDVLGIRLNQNDRSYASFDIGGAELVLHADSDLPDQATYFLVDNVRDLYARREQMKLQFLAPPAPASRGWRASVKDPFGNVLLLIDRTAESAASFEMPAGNALFSGVENKTPIHRELLAELYEKIGRTADDLPYTPHFESLYTAYIEPMPEPKPTRAEVWRHVLNLRKKKGGLAKLGSARSQPPAISDDQRARLLEMLGPDIGRRDRLPYTDRFDRIVDEFNHGMGRPLSPHLVWRLVATLAK